MYNFSERKKESRSKPITTEHAKIRVQRYSQCACAIGNAPCHVETSAVIDNRKKRKMKLVSALVLVCFAGFSASEYTVEKNVLVLGDANIAEAIAETEHLLVEFCKFP